MERIARVVNDHEGIISTRQVMADLGGENANMISAYLVQLVQRGQIWRVGYGLYASLEGTTDEN
jgi:predicted transcriptional regulator of viral defense system